MPVTGRDEFMEAVLAVGDGAHLVGDAVLALHGLADVNPARFRIGTPNRARRTELAEPCPRRSRSCHGAIDLTT